MGSRRIKEHEETNITNVGTKSIVSEKEKKIRKKKITVKNNSVIKKNNNTNNVNIMTVEDCFFVIKLDKIEFTTQIYTSEITETKVII